MTFSSYSVDPFNSDYQYYLRYRTSYYSGSEPTFTVPASPNFPDSRADTPTRYFYEFPATIDLTDVAGSRPITLRNTTDGVDLTRVTGSLSSNQYRVSPSTSERRSIIEFHSGLAGKTIAYDLYATSGIINATQFNDISNTSITSTTMTATNLIYTNLYTLYRTSGGSETSTYLKTKIIEIGDWDMNANNNKNVAHAITDWKKIVNVNAVIRHDNDTTYYNLTESDATGNINGGIEYYDSTNIVLVRKTSGLFDTINFDSISYNRGYVFITYMI